MANFFYPAIFSDSINAEITHFTRKILIAPQ